MSCACSNQSDYFYFEDATPGFNATLVRKETSFTNWCALWACSECGTLWIVDEPEKHDPVVVFRARHAVHWDRDTGFERHALSLREK